jgi:hypothetical protein
VLNLACLAVSFVPGRIAAAVSTVVGTVSIVAQETQRRYRTNRALHRYNEMLLKPCSLLAKVMSYEPDASDDAILQANISDPTQLALPTVLDLKQSSKLQQVLCKFRDASDVSHSNDQVPEYAHLSTPRPSSYIAVCHKAMP